MFNRITEDLRVLKKGIAAHLKGISCLFCFALKDEDRINLQQESHAQKQLPTDQSGVSKLPSGADRLRSRTNGSSHGELSSSKNVGRNIEAPTFSYAILRQSTNNFAPESLLGEGGFGHVYKGCLPDTHQLCAVKKLDVNGLQGNREFVVEVLMLRLLDHPNLVNLIGHCAEAEQRLLVYEFMPLGSLDDHLHGQAAGKVPLDWNTRLKIAVGAAKGLEYLHNEAQPPVIYRDFKSSNILLDEGFNPKLSDFGMAKLGPTGDKSHVSTRVMGTYGYCAPEYAMTGQLTLKSDIYSFGVCLLELITGRKAMDSSQPHGEQSLAAWFNLHRQECKSKKTLNLLADPKLKSKYPEKGIRQALAVASLCIHEEATSRPLISDVVSALSFIEKQAYDPNSSANGREGEAPPCSGGPAVTTSSDDREGPGDRTDLELDRFSRNNFLVASLRQQAVAEAKSWGASWRDKKQT